MYQNSDMATFGQRLRAARKNALLTQAAAAKKAGMGQPTLSELENDAYPTSTFTPKLAQIYGVNYWWLAEERGAMVGGEDLGPPPQEDKDEPIWPFVSISKGDYQSIADDDRRMIESVIKVIIEAKRKRPDLGPLLAGAEEQALTTSRQEEGNGRRLGGVKR